MSRKGDACDPAASGRDAPETGHDLPRIPKALPAHGGADAGLKDLVIFSPPAVELVFQWWRESNRRWTARNRVKTPAA